MTLFVLCVGLPGRNRSSGTVIKREENEDDENCSVTDKSEDDRKDLKARLRTRCPNSECIVMFYICHIFAYSYIYIYRTRIFVVAELQNHHN